MSDNGLDRMNRRFAAVLRNVKEVVQPSLLKSGNQLADLQRQLAPEDTGALKDSIAVTPPGGHDAALFPAGREPHGEGE